MVISFLPAHVYGDEDVISWIKRYGINPSVTYRIDVDTDLMVAEFYTYRVNEQGQMYVGDDGEIARMELIRLHIAEYPSSGFVYA